MAGRIVVFGATGYTGEQTARALVTRGARPILAARSPERLEALAAELGGLDAIAADVGKPESVRALVEPDDVLLSTVGPFSRYGEPAVTAAVDAGASYLDSTGEPAFIRRVFEQHGPRAERAGVALLTAFGYDWVPGNLAGAIALEEAGEAATRVEIAYFNDAGTSGGTKASTITAILDPSFAFRDGELSAEPAGAKARSFNLPGGSRRIALSAGGTEHFGLPSIYPQLRDVDVLIGHSGPQSRLTAGLMRAVPLAVRAVATAFMVPGLRGSVQGLAERRVPGSTGGPDERARRNSSSVVLANAYDRDGRRLSEVRLAGVNPYTFTFEILAWAATRLAESPPARRGALSPAQAFDLDVLEDGVRQAGISRAAD